MKVLIYDVDFNNDILIEDGSFLGVECESTDYFASMIANCKGYCNDHIAILDDKGKELNFEKDVLTIIDFYSLEQITKSALLKLYKQMDSVYNDEEHFGLLEQIEKSVRALLESIDVYNMDFDYEVPATLSSYMKLCDVKLKNYSGNVYEDVVDLAALIGTTKMYKVFILVNAKSFFKKDELQEIAKGFIYSKQPLILIDNVVTEEKLEKEKKLVVDSDFYDIML